MLSFVLLTSTLIAGSPESTKHTADAPGGMNGAAMDSLIDALWSRPLPVPEMRGPVQPGPVDETAGMGLLELAYHWIHRTGMPTEMERLRLLQACRARPDLTFGLLEFLPVSESTVEIVRNAHQRWPHSKFRDWLVLHDEAATEALLLRVSLAELDDGPEFAYRALVGLAQRGWKQAAPILMSLAGMQGNYGAAASRVLFEYFAASELSDEMFAWRRRLQRLALDAQLDPDVRGLALAGVMSTQWAGRSRWFLTHIVRLIDHESTNLPDMFGWIVKSVHREPEVWLPALAGMVGSPQRAQHLAAVAVLALYLRRVPDARAAKVLLPWTTSAKWAGELGHSLRLDYFEALARVELPQSLPALAQILKRMTHLPYERESPDVVVRAARAVAQYCRPRLKEPLRKAALQLPVGPQRDVLLDVLLQCGMYEWSDVHTAVLRHLEYLVDVDGARKDGHAPPVPSYDAQLGRVALDQDDLTDDTIFRLVRVMSGMNRTGPLLYPKFLPIVHRWPHPHVARSLLLWLSQGRLDGDPLIHALDMREQIRALQSPKLARLVAGTGSMAGFAAVLSGDSEAQIRVLKGDDRRARTALLAAARWAGELLPVSALRPLLDLPSVAPRVRRYLSSLDDVRARSLLQGVCGRDEASRGFPRKRWRARSGSFPHGAFVHTASIREFWQVEMWEGNAVIQDIAIQDVGTSALLELTDRHGTRRAESLPPHVLARLRAQFQRYGLDRMVDMADERPRRRFSGQGPVFRVRHATPMCASEFLVHDPWRHAVVEPQYWEAIFTVFEAAEQAGFALPMVGLPRDG